MLKNLNELVNYFIIKLKNWNSSFVFVYMTNHLYNYWGNQLADKYMYMYTLEKI